MVERIKKIVDRVSRREGKDLREFEVYLYDGWRGQGEEVETVLFTGNLRDCSRFVQRARCRTVSEVAMRATGRILPLPKVN